MSTWKNVKSPWPPQPSKGFGHNPLKNGACFERASKTYTRVPEIERTVLGWHFSGWWGRLVRQCGRAKPGIWVALWPTVRAKPGSAPRAHTYPQIGPLLLPAGPSRAKREKSADPRRVGVALNLEPFRLRLGGSGVNFKMQKYTVSAPLRKLPRSTLQPVAQPLQPALQPCSL